MSDTAVAVEPPPPDAALFPAETERQEIDDFLTRELSRAQARVARGPATPTFDLAAFREELRGFDFSAPRPLRPLLDWSVAVLEHGVVHLTHPRYFGLFNPAPSFPAQCADRIASSFNPQLASHATSPAAVALEAHVIQMRLRGAQVCRWVPAATSPPAARRRTTRRSSAR